MPAIGGEVAERSKALRSGRSLFGGVGSNPTLTIFEVQRQCKLAEVGFDPTTCGLWAHRADHCATLLVHDGMEYVCVARATDQSARWQTLPQLGSNQRPAG